MAVSGKITLKKISGKGEITGKTTIDIDSNGSATFDDIQFTEPGDYVIAVTYTGSNNVSITKKEIKYHIEEAEKVTEQEKNDEPEKDVTGNTPILTNLIKPTIKKPVITIFTKDVPTNEQEFSNGVGYIPIISYKGHIIDRNYIRRMRLYHNGILPMIDISFTDPQGYFKNEDDAPRENEVFSLFINSASKYLRSILVDFKILSVVRNKRQKFTLTGYLNIPNIYERTTDVNAGTSFKVLQRICKSVGLGFNSNVGMTKDAMVWRGDYSPLYEYMNSIVKHSYTSESSFMAGYIDYYYCFNYVDIQKEFTRDNSKDVCINTYAKLRGDNINDDKKSLTSLVLTNDPSEANSNLYLTAINESNYSTEKAIKHGNYAVNTSYNSDTKQIEQFNSKQLTTNGEKSKPLIGNSDSDVSGLNTNSKLDENGRTDTDNLHKNYNYSKTVNEINVENFNKLQIEVTLPNSNLNLYMSQKVHLMITNAAKTPTQNKIDHRLSTDYIINDIEYSWDGNKLSQILSLVTPEVGKTPKDIKNDENTKTVATPVGTVSTTKETSSTTKKDDVERDPNDSFNIGDILNIKNISTKTVYEMTVMQILNDKVSIRADLRNANEYLPDNIFDVSTSGQYKLKNTKVIYENTTESAYTNDTLEVSSEYTENATEAEAEVYNVADNSRSFTTDEIQEQIDFSLSYGGGMIDYPASLSEKIPISKASVVINAITRLNLGSKGVAVVPSAMIRIINASITGGNTWGFCTPSRIAHLLGQCAVESGAFRYKKESGNNNKYCGRGYIQLTHDYNYKAFNKFLHNIRPSAPDVYANPEYMEQEDYAVLASLWYFTQSSNGRRITKSWNTVTTGSIVSITKAINGGTTALNDRSQATNIYMKAISSVLK